MNMILNASKQFCVIGLGSMGKRRISILRALGIKDIIGYDIKKERIEQAVRDYGITYQRFEDIKSADVFIISTSPDHHNGWLENTIVWGKPAFVDASVVLGNLEELNQEAKEKNVLICPSCTFQFDKYVMGLKKAMKEQNLGRVVNFTFHLGQYLPDWHPYEKVSDYYAGQKKTGGAREMVTFDWTWLFDLLDDFPTDIAGFYGKTMDLGADIDDTYGMVLKFKDKIGVMMTDVVSRDYTKRLLINTDKCQIQQDWMSADETMYTYEIKAFLDAVEGKKSFPNTLDRDIKILKLLEKYEKPTIVGKS